MIVLRVAVGLSAAGSVLGLWLASHGQPDAINMGVGCGIAAAFLGMLLLIGLLAR